MVFRDQEEWRFGANTSSYGHVRCEKMHRSHGNYSEQRLCLLYVYVYMYTSNFATLNNTRFLLLHEYINPTN